MKKLFCFLILLGLSIGIAACENETGTSSGASSVLDFRSIVDTESGHVFSLGDTRNSIEAVLGQPIEMTQWGVEFQNGLFVEFEDNLAVYFEAENGLAAGRFEIYGYSIGMTKNQIASIFALDEMMSSILTNPELGRIVSWFELYYDANGNVTNQENADTFTAILWVEQPEGNYVRLSIGIE